MLPFPPMSKPSARAQLVDRFCDDPPVKLLDG